MSDHILYQVNVVNQKKRKTFNSWTVLKRFGQFHEMDHAVRQNLSDKPQVIAQLPPLPPRKGETPLDSVSASSLASFRRP